MGNFLPMQAEEIILSSDVETFVIQIKAFKMLVVQVVSEDGAPKNVKVIGNTVLPYAKTLLKKGDTIKYIAVF